MEKTQKKKKKMNKGLYIVGSLAVAAGAVIVMPKVIEYLSDKMYTPSAPDKKDDDDWGPEIVRREKPTETTETEENTDGKL